MRKKICILLCGLTMVFSTGCEVIVHNDELETEEVSYGRLITITEEFYYDDFGNRHWQYITYDKDTKIMYLIDQKNYGISVSPYYILNSNNEPVIGIYNSEMEIK